MYNKETTGAPALVNWNLTGETVKHFHRFFTGAPVTNSQPYFKLTKVFQIKVLWEANKLVGWENVPIFARRFSLHVRRSRTVYRQT